MNREQSNYPPYSDSRGRERAGTDYSEQIPVGFDLNKTQFMPADSSLPGPGYGQPAPGYGQPAPGYG
ncbi:MAG: hypothetical protein ACI38Q_05560, partial [Candidatus Bruticola sp.]